MKAIKSIGTSRNLEVSSRTKVRVLSRIEAANRPYVAHRRDFTSAAVKRNRVATALLKGFAWTLV